jgi:hypothetical protein
MVETMSYVLLLVIAAELGYLIFQRRGALPRASSARKLTQSTSGAGLSTTSTLAVTLPPDIADNLVILTSEVKGLRTEARAADDYLRGQFFGLNEVAQQVLRYLREEMGPDQNDSLMRLEQRLVSCYDKLDEIELKSREVLSARSGTATTAGVAAARPAAPAPAALPHAPAQPQPTHPGAQQLPSGAAQQRPTYPAQPLPVVAPKGADTFKRLQNWVYNNMREIMERSRLNPGMGASDLLSDAPRDLKITAEIIDIKSRVLTIGSQDCTRHLAVVLPGAFVGATYEDWFDMSKGTNRRIEETITPALIEQVDGGYRIEQPGKVRQD